MNSFEKITALDDGTYIDAVAWNALLEDPQPEVPLVWYVSIDDVATEWEDLKGIAHLAQLVTDLAEDGDFMVIQDPDPSTRYAQTMRLESGKLTIELGMLLPEGALNLRVGRGPAATAEPNNPELAATELQELNSAETIQVLTSWAAGSGLPAGYSGAIYSYI